MRRLLLLIIFVVALVVLLIWYMPARIAISQLNQVLDEEQIAVDLDQATGRAWDGQARWSWQANQGNIGWHLDWRDWSPGVAFSVSGNDLKVTGWGSGNASEFILDNVRLQLPLVLLLTGQTEVQATGSVHGIIKTLVFANNQVRALDGTLDYAGGEGRWKNERATLPPMNARLYKEKTVARIDISDENQQTLAKATLATNGMGTLKVLRAYAEAVGMSEGRGNLTDVILKFEQPVIPAAGS